MEASGCAPNSRSYNAIITGFLQHKDPLDAAELIQEMVSKGFSADATTMSLIVGLDNPFPVELLGSSDLGGEEKEPKGLLTNTIQGELCGTQKPLESHYNEGGQVSDDCRGME
ncbi:unnamed protein product [Linum tenue]|nr:unnamed protein product [Linum tenue]